MSARSESDLDESFDDTTQIQKPELPPVNIYSILDTKDFRNLWWRFLDDQTLIQSFIKPVYKKGRKYALNELFSRKSKKATEYRHNYLRYYLSHNLILEQSLSSTQLTELSKKYPTELGFFALVLTARVKFGDEHAPHVEGVLNKMSSLDYKNSRVSHHYHSDILRCKILLNGLDIPLYLQSIYHNTQLPHFHFYNEQIQYQQKIIIDAIDGDITQVNSSLRGALIDCLIETLFHSKEANLHRISFENWCIKDQQLLIKEFIRKLLYSWMRNNTIVSHFNFDQFDENVLHGFIDELFSHYDQASSRVSNILAHILEHTKKASVIQKIVEKSLIELDLNVLCHVNLDDLTDELKEKYLNLLLQPYPNKDRSYYIYIMLRKLDFTKIREYENRLISNVLHHSSTRFRLNFLVSKNFSTLTEENQNSLIEKILSELFSTKYKNVNYSALVKVSPTLQNAIAKMAIFSDLDDVENNTTKIRILCALDLQVIEFEIREMILKLLKDELINPRVVPLYKELSKQFSLIKLSVDEKNKLIITLRDYINSFFNTPSHGDIVAKKIQRDNFCQNGLHALEFISLEKLNKDDSTFFFTWLRWILLNNKSQVQNKMFALKTLRRFDLNTLDEALQTKHIYRLFKLIGFSDDTQPFISMSEIAAETLFSKRLNTLSESLQHLIVKIIIDYIYNPKHVSGSQARVISWVYSELPEESDYRREIKQALIDDLALNCPIHYKTLHLILSSDENTKLNKRYFQSAKSAEKQLKVLPYFWFSASKKHKDLFLSEDAKETKFEDSVENSLDPESSEAFPG